VADQFPGPMPNEENVQQDGRAPNLRSDPNNNNNNNDQNSPLLHGRDLFNTYRLAPFTSPGPKANLMNKSYPTVVNRQIPHLGTRMKPSDNTGKPNKSKGACRNLWRGIGAGEWENGHSVGNRVAHSHHGVAQVVKDDNNNNNDQVHDLHTDQSPSRRREHDINVEKSSSDEDDDVDNSSDFDNSLDLESPLRTGRAKDLTAWMGEDEEMAGGDDDDSDDKNDSAIQDMSMDLSISDFNNSKFLFPPSTPIVKHRAARAPLAAKGWSKAAREKGSEGHQSTVSPLNVDRSTVNAAVFKNELVASVNKPHSESDLLLSSPDNYTAQVCNILFSERIFISYKKEI